jgi:hypothetical protein
MMMMIVPVDEHSGLLVSEKNEQGRVSSWGKDLLMTTTLLFIVGFFKIISGVDDETCFLFVIILFVRRSGQQEAPAVVNAYAE